MMMQASAIVLITGVFSVVSISAFTATTPVVRSHRQLAVTPKTTPTTTAAAAAWNGEVVTNNNNGNADEGRIRGCTIAPVVGTTGNNDDSPLLATEWTVAIDGVEADLGRFSEAVYQKFVRDAKQQRFQGFRPGTIPPHLEPTYRVFAMDECSRETVLEALSQNSIRPFERCRSELMLGRFQIPPPLPPPSKARAGGSKKAKSTRNKSMSTATDTDKGAVEKDDTVDATVDDTVDDAANGVGWRTFETMKDAVDAGWKPGQSFSFVATNVKGQKVKQESDTAGASPVARPF